MIDLPIDEARFSAAVDAAGERSGQGIGTQNEKLLHAALKKYFCLPGGREEAPVGRYIADVLNPDGIVEIQTGSCYTLKKKLAALSADGRLTLVLPLMRRKTIYWIDRLTGEVSPGRKSPKVGCCTDLLPELCHLTDFLNDRSFSLLFFLYDGEEYRVRAPGGGKGYGARRIDRLPLRAVKLTEFGGTRGDFTALIPDECRPSFRREEFSRKTRLRGRRLYYALTALEGSGAVRKEKAGRAYIYTVIDAADRAAKEE